MSLAELVFAAGVVGAGGAGFPTHKKLTGSARLLVANGAECEPLLASDRYVMRHEAAEVIAGLEAIRRELGCPEAVIGLKRTYVREIAALEAAIAAQGAAVSLHLVDSFYPAGDEQTLIFEITGQTVPPGGLPLALGIVVVNVTTARNVAFARRGEPVTRRLVTVNGAVRRPAVVDAPVGTTAADLVDAAGGTTAGAAVFVQGGPLMGAYHPWSDAASLGFGKANGGLVVLPAQHRLALQAAKPVERIIREAQSACIQCQACTDLCPRHLIGHRLRPHRVMRAAGTEEAVLLDPLLCCECGICELIACPMGLSPRRVIQYAKGALRASGARLDGPAAAVWPEQQAGRPGRRIAQSRLVAHLGLDGYPGQVDDLVVCEPSRVAIPLRHGAGRPARPVVAAGDEVTAGQVIAAVGPDEVGCLVHASIGGRIAEVAPGFIAIERK